MSLAQRIQEVAERHVGDSRVPGLVVLVGHGDDVYVEAFGHLGIGRPPVQRGSLFRIASITKPITSVLGVLVARAAGQAFACSRALSCPRRTPRFGVRHLKPAK